MKTISIDNVKYKVVKEFSLHKPDLVDDTGWIAKSPTGERVFIKTTGGHTHFVATEKELIGLYEFHSKVAFELSSALVEFYKKYTKKLP